MNKQVIDDDQPIGIVALWRLMWANKVRIAFPAMLFAAIAAFLVIRSSDTFTSEAQIILTRGNLDIIELDGVFTTELTSGEIANAMTILNSRNLATQVADRLDLVNDPEINPFLTEVFEPHVSLRDRIFSWLGLDEDPDAALEDVEEASVDTLARQYALDWLGDTISFIELPGTNVIILQATTYDAASAADVVNAYAENFLEYKLGFQQRQLESAMNALSTRVGELRLQLKTDQNALHEFEIDATRLTAEALQGLLAEARDVRGRLGTAQSNVQQYDKVLAQLDQLGSGDAQGARAEFDADTALFELEASIFGRHLEAAELLERIPQVVAVVEARQIQSSRLETALLNTLESLDAQIEEGKAFDIEYRQLSVELETTSQVYETSLARLKELTTQSGVRDAGAQIIARGEVPLRYDAQGRRRIVVIAFVLGLLVGCAYVLLREATNERVRRPGELIDSTGSNSIIQMPKIKRGMLAGIASDNNGFGGGKPLFVESARTLRQTLLNKQQSGSSRLVIGMFSALPQEGKTTAAVGLARAFTMVGQSVLFIDTDLRNSNLRRALGSDDSSQSLQVGLEAPELDLKKIVERRGDMPFDVVYGGKGVLNPADLLASKRFEQIVEAAKQHYSVIIIDTPPILVVPDAAEIARTADQHILVAEHDRSPQSAVREAAEILRSWGADDLTVVLSGAPDVFGKQYGVGGTRLARYRMG